MISISSCRRFFKFQSVLQEFRAGKPQEYPAGIDFTHAAEPSGRVAIMYLTRGFRTKPGNFFHNRSTMFFPGPDRAHKCI